MLRVRWSRRRGGVSASAVAPVGAGRGGGCGGGDGGPQPSSVVRRGSAAGRRPSSVVRRPSPVVRRPSPVARRPSLECRRPSAVVTNSVKRVPVRGQMVAVFAGEWCRPSAVVRRQKHRQTIPVLAARGSSKTASYDPSVGGQVESGVATKRGPLSGCCFRSTCAETLCFLTFTRFVEARKRDTC